jgi:uncharacterized protein
MPDLVRIRFRVARTEPTPAQAFAVTSEGVRLVRQALREHGVPDSGVDHSRMDLKSSWSHVNNERRFNGYHCQASFSVESRDLDDVQQLLVDVVAAGPNEIDGIDFDVTTKAELRRAARRKAIEAARSKAELYAEAAGVRLGAIIHIDDVDPENAGVERYKSHSSAGAASAEDLAPGHIVVSASVALGFTILHD